MRGTRDVITKQYVNLTLSDQFQRVSLPVKSILLFVALSLVCVACNAQSVMFGKRLVSQGDGVARVREVAGSPDKIDKIPGDGSSPPMEIWTYRRKENVIVLFVVDAKVVHTQEKPAETRVAGDAGSTQSVQVAPSR